MGFLFSEVFWGVLLVIIGTAVIIRGVFHIDIPIFSIILAFILIYGGIRILVGGYGFAILKNTTLFNDTEIHITEPAETYNTIFGRGVIDFTKVNLNNQIKKINVHTIFGASTILLHPETPVKIMVNTAFAETVMPDGNQIQFGTTVYQSKTYKADQNALLIETSVVFGGLVIINR